MKVPEGGELAKALLCEYIGSGCFGIGQNRIAVWLAGDLV